MNKKKLLTPLWAVVLFFAYSCQTFDDINQNPDAPTKVTAALLANSLIMSTVEQSSGQGFLSHNLLSKHLAWTDRIPDYQYNRLDRTGFGPYQILTNIEPMINYAGDQEKNAYEGLGLFVKAYQIYYVSMSLGDVPYKNALLGENGIVKPEYDSQKEVMLQVLADLRKADNLLKGSKNFSGDPLHKGNALTWRKIVNSFRLKVLMSLSIKENDSDLNIKKEFADVMELPILESNDENLQLVYSNKEKEVYPFNKTKTNDTEYPILSSVLVDSLKKLKDYRLFYYASPSKYQIEQGVKPEEWEAYIGVDPSADFDSNKLLSAQGKSSKLNGRYTIYQPGEPLQKVGYAEQNFIISEAIIRKWIPGDAKKYYEEGIRAALSFTSYYTPDTYVSSQRIISDEYVNTYLNGENVRFASTDIKELEQIWIQKYIIYFMQYPWDSYYEYRRTNYPHLPINPSTNLNVDVNSMPLRWMYPQNEYDVNLENIEVALQRQFNGQDKVNDKMWILKP